MRACNNAKHANARPGVRCRTWAADGSVRGCRPEGGVLHHFFSSVSRHVLLLWQRSRWMTRRYVCLRYGQPDTVGLAVSNSSTKKLFLRTRRCAEPACGRHSCVARGPCVSLVASETSAARRVHAYGGEAGTDGAGGAILGPDFPPGIRPGRFQTVSLGLPGQQPTRGASASKIQVWACADKDADLAFRATSGPCLANYIHK